jgi:squalene cyclase/subtilisin family serine protease
MTAVNMAVLSPRLLAAIRGPGAETDTSLISVLLRFRDDGELQAFVKNPTEIANRIGAAPGSLTIKRIIPALKFVSAEMEVRAIGPLSSVADEVGITVIDENTRVTAFANPAAAVGAAAAPGRPGLFGLTGKGIKLAVLDTGIDGSHPDLTGRVGPTKDFSGDGPGDRVGHGTHVGGLLAGSGQADPAYRALAWEAEIVDAKVLNDQGNGRVDAILEGIVWAVEEAKAEILSLSLGVVGNFDGTDPMSEAVTWAVNKGKVVLVAAGNCGPSGSEIVCSVRGPRSIASPGVAAAVITVGATDAIGNVAPYSSRGPTLAGLLKPDVVIGGTDLVAARARGVRFGRVVNDSYTSASGTSMATPRCAAVVALLLEAAHRAKVDLSPQDVKTLLKDSATPIANIAPSWQGSGVVDADKCLSLFYQRFAAGGEQGEAEATKTLTFTLELDGEAPFVLGTTRTWRLTARNAADRPMHELRVNLGGRAVQVQTRAGQALEAGKLDPGASVSDVVRMTAIERGTAEVTLQATFQWEENGETVLVRQVRSLEVAGAPARATSERVQEILGRASDLLLRRQRPNGSWAGDIMFNAWTNGMYCIMHKILGLDGEPTLALRWLETHRNGLDEQGLPDETHGILDPPSLHFIEATLVSAVALEIWGRPRHQKSWDFIRRMSEARLANVIDQADPFTQSFVSLASEFRPPGVPAYYSLNDVLAPPIEIIAIPSFIPASIGNLFAAWGMDAVVALAAVGTVAKNKNPTVLQQLLLAKAERHLLRSQSADGGWYGTILPTLAGTLGMFFLGYKKDHPVMVRAVRFMQNQMRSDGYVVRYELPVWDTALAILVLREAGLAATDSRLARAGQYLLSAQAPNGGVPFKPENILYPDTDDTAFAILALDQLALPAALTADYVRRGLDWLFFMQGRDGGWAAFGKDQAIKAPNRAPVFKDDPPTADVTGHVLSALKVIRDPARAAQVEEAKQRAFDWLLQQQLPSGGWYGRWGMTVTYGTGAVLQAIDDLGESPDQPFVQAGVRYLINKQQADGGWGEGIRSYYDVDANESAPSTVEQTAWSLVGLMSVPRTEATWRAIERGITFLTDRFDEQQGWGSGSYVVGALWIYKHDLYPLIWPIWALARYLQAKGAP